MRFPAIFEQNLKFQLPGSPGCNTAVLTQVSVVQVPARGFKTLPVTEDVEPELAQEDKLQAERLVLLLPSQWVISHLRLAA